MGMARMDFRVKFVEKEELDMEGYTLIEGFPGLGLVGTISAKYLVDKMKFKMIGYIDSDSFIPIIRIHEGVPMHPSRIYANEELKIVILISEQIIPKEHTQTVADAVVDWIELKGIKKVISLSGINTESAGKTQVYGLGANQHSLKMLEEHGIEVIKEGLTTGVTALILLRLKEVEDVETISLLGSISMDADYKASAELLKKLSEVLSLNLNVEPLLKEAKETQKELLAQLEKLRQTHDTVQRIEKGTPMYT